MAQSERFSLALRILLALAERPGENQTSAALAESLQSSPVMVRRMFVLLHRAGLLVGQKGPSGGARLRTDPKQVRVGDVFLATEPQWLHSPDPLLNKALSRSRREAVDALNESSLATLIKRRRKAEETLASRHTTEV